MTDRGGFVSRRAFLGAAAGLGIAAGGGALHALLSPTAIAGSCAPTPPNPEGPYWRADAPFRTDLREGVTGGAPLVVTGRLLDAECRPVANAVLDVWQADHLGRYDLDRKDITRELHLLRGRVRTDGDGNYRFVTIKPAPYGSEGWMRPAHIHYAIRQPGYAPLATQLYFAGDEYLDADPLRAVRRELVSETVPVASAEARRELRLGDGFLAARFDITLRKG